MATNTIDTIADKTTKDRRKAVPTDAAEMLVPSTTLTPTPDVLKFIATAAGVPLDNLAVSLTFRPGSPFYELGFTASPSSSSLARLSWVLARDGSGSGGVSFALGERPGKFAFCAVAPAAALKTAWGTAPNHKTLIQADPNNDGEITVSSGPADPKMASPKVRTSAVIPLLPPPRASKKAGDDAEGENIKWRRMPAAQIAVALNMLNRKSVNIKSPVDDEPADLFILPGHPRTALGFVDHTHGILHTYVTDDESFSAPLLLPSDVVECLLALLKAGVAIEALSLSVSDASFRIEARDADDDVILSIELRKKHDKDGVKPSLKAVKHRASELTKRLADAKSWKSGQYIMRSADFEDALAAFGSTTATEITMSLGERSAILSADFGHGGRSRLRKTIRNLVTTDGRKPTAPSFTVSLHDLMQVAAAARRVHKPGPAKSYVWISPGEDNQVLFVWCAGDKASSILAGKGMSKAELTLALVLTVMPRHGSA